MMNEKDKKRLRRIKRVVKRSGNKKVRSKIKRDIAQNPEEAHLGDIDYGAYNSKKYNGMDRDATRQKDDPDQLPLVD
jgi:hypothetical protein